jgi:hypothetical protein
MIVVQFEYERARMSRAVDTSNMLAVLMQLHHHFPGARPYRLRDGLSVLWGDPLPLAATLSSQR